MKAPSLVQYRSLAKFGLIAALSGFLVAQDRVQIRPEPQMAEMQAQIKTLELRVAALERRLGIKNPPDSPYTYKILPLTNGPAPAGSPSGSVPNR